MKLTSTLLIAASMTAMLSACSSNDTADLTGSWKSAAPISVTAGVDGSTSATKTMTFVFDAPAADNTGSLTLTSDYDVTVPYSAESETTPTSFKVTASIKGTWAPEKNGDDDYLLSFDSNTLSVSGVDAPELGPVTDEFLTSLGQFTKIEDVKITDSGKNLKFETDHPDADFHFVKAE